MRKVEREKKRKRRKGGDGRKEEEEEAPANSPPEWPECSVNERCTRAWIGFVFFAHFSYVGGAFCFSSLLASAAKCMKMLF
jgi:hypothetical protein